MLDDEEMVAILEQIARDGKSDGARIEAVRQLRLIRKGEGEGGSTPRSKDQAKDEFEGLYAVENPGRVRRAS